MADHDKTGQGASAFRAFLRQLPDDIAAARDDGFPIVVVTGRPLKPSASRLMDSLGVEVLLVNQGVRTAEAADGGLVILAAFCERCETESMPDRAGCCSFCGRQIVDEDRLTAKAAIAAINPIGGDPLDETCKMPDCEEPAVDSRGRYAKLCAAHKREAIDAAASTRTGVVPARSSVSGGASSVSEACKVLHAIGKRLDRARAQLEQAPATDAAKAAFDEASRRASVNPTPEALRRVQETVVALQQVQPKRSKLDDAHTHTVREFKDQLAIIMRLVAA